MEQDGILVINKPLGLSSHDVVIKLRRAYGMKKVGHTGTLDPMVEGAMVIAFGKATKLVRFLTEENKRYHVGIKLGCQTDTEDLTGKILTEIVINENMSAALLQEVPHILADFVGSYKQIPPMYAAIKFRGKKLYEYARRKQTIERTPRQLHIFSMDYDRDSFQYDEATQTSSFAFDVHASKGLYARTLCVDIGQALGVPATMATLTRLAVGSYTLAQAHDLHDVLMKPPALIALKDIMLPCARAYVDDAVACKLRTGYKLPHHFIDESFLADEVFAVYDKIDKELIGIYKQSEKYPKKYQSIRVM